MSHNAFVKGLLENGYQVEILMSKDSWGEHDSGLPRWEQAKYYTYRSVTLQDKLRKKAGRMLSPAHQTEQTTVMASSGKQRFKNRFRQMLKRMYYVFFPIDPIYPLDREWLKRAATFKSETEYDLVLSNSSPAASHKLAGELIGRGAVSCKRWIQIWEDPWYYDLYGNHSELVRQEEHMLLKEADEICYVSPLTLKYQRQAFPDCAEKMRHIPLPSLHQNSPDIERQLKWDLGYFGDYYSITRDLVPFYEALVQSGLIGIICGDSDSLLSPTEKITVSRRITLDKLEEIQKSTRILVHLSNRRGGQIPGKIYHYSATDKPILFILDGTNEEQIELEQYFGKFGRFYFCKNNVESIATAINGIIQEKQVWKPVNEFLPKQIVFQL